EDANHAPTAFTRNSGFNATDTGGSQWHQTVVNNARNTLYYAAFAASSPSVVKLNAGSPVDASFPQVNTPNNTGVAIDSQDRFLYAVAASADSISALNPLLGTNLTVNPPFKPSNLTRDYGNGHYVELSRYSDRHYFYLACFSVGTSPSSTFGVFGTDVPAPP